MVIDMLTEPDHEILRLRRRTRQTTCDSVVSGLDIHRFLWDEGGCRTMSVSLGIANSLRGCSSFGVLEGMRLVAGHAPTKLDDEMSETTKGSATWWLFTFGIIPSLLAPRVSRLRLCFSLPGRFFNSTLYSAGMEIRINTKIDSALHVVSYVWSSTK